MKRISVKASSIDGHGLYANESFKTGELVNYISGPPIVIKKFTPHLSRSTNNWIGFGRYTWINTDTSKFRFINHSCDPNLYISTRRSVMALHDIAPGSELTIDYSLTECEPNWLITPCNCKTKQCRGTIGNIFSLSRTFIYKNRHRIPKKFYDLYCRHHNLSPQ